MALIVAATLSSSAVAQPGLNLCERKGAQGAATTSCDWPVGRQLFSGFFYKDRDKRHHVSLMTSLVSQQNSNGYASSEG